MYLKDILFIYVVLISVLTGTFFSKAVIWRQFPVGVVIKAVQSLCCPSIYAPLSVSHCIRPTKAEQQTHLDSLSGIVLLCCESFLVKHGLCFFPK